MCQPKTMTQQLFLLLAELAILATLAAANDTWPRLSDLLYLKGDADGDQRKGDCRGYDVEPRSTALVDDVHACYDLCQAVSACAFFVFWSETPASGHNCYPKTAECRWNAATGRNSTSITEIRIYRRERRQTCGEAVGGGKACGGGARVAQWDGNSTRTSECNLVSFPTAHRLSGSPKPPALAHPSASLPAVNTDAC